VYKNPLNDTTASDAVIQVKRVIEGELTSSLQHARTNARTLRFFQPTVLLLVILTSVCSAKGQMR